jgi:hypothetical protein
MSNLIDMKQLFKRKQKEANQQEKQEQRLKRRNIFIRALEASVVALTIWTCASMLTDIRPPQRLISPTQRAEFEKFKDVCGSTELSPPEFSEFKDIAEIPVVENSPTRCAEILYRRAVSDAMAKRPDLQGLDGGLSTFRYLIETSVLQSVDLDPAYLSSLSASKKETETPVPKSM